MKKIICTSFALFLLACVSAPVMQAQVMCTCSSGINYICSQWPDTCAACGENCGIRPGSRNCPGDPDCWQQQMKKLLVEKKAADKELAEIERLWKLRRMLLGITQAFTPVSKSMTDAAKNLAQDSGLPPGSCPGDPRCGELPSQQPPPPPPSGCDDPVMRQDLPCMIIGTRGDLAYTPIR